MRIKHFFLTCLTFTAALFAPTPAFSTDSYPTKYFYNWEVYGWDDNCWMSQLYSDKTRILYNWNSNDGSYFTISNPNWSSIVDRKFYNIELQFDDWNYSTKASGGAKSESGLYSIGFFADEPIRFRTAIAKSSFLVIRIGSKLIGKYSLKGSDLAVSEVLKCDSFIKRKPVDPFKGE